MQIIVATLSFLILDGIWLGFIGKKWYVAAFGHLMRMHNGNIQPTWPAAVVVYIALISGILLFVIPKANGNSFQALLWGGLFGFICYATYDFTNLAVLTDWTLKISIIDTIWGTFLCGITSYITVLVTK